MMCVGCMAVAGRISAVVDGMVVVAANQEAHVLVEGSILALPEHRCVLGAVTELFGPTHKPMYRLVQPVRARAIRYYPGCPTDIYGASKIDMNQLRNPIRYAISSDAHCTAMWLIAAVFAGCEIGMLWPCRRTCWGRRASEWAEEPKWPSSPGRSASPVVPSTHASLQLSCSFYVRACRLTVLACMHVCTSPNAHMPARVLRRSCWTLASTSHRASRPTPATRTTKRCAPPYPLTNRATAGSFLHTLHARENTYK
eukprot:COSAG02_NODE_16180_length_1106_cov_1.790467_2_plen_254_part_01